MLSANTAEFKERLVAVPDWLSARYLLQSLPVTVIESCFEKIIHSFKTKNDVISTLVRASTTEQIRSIINILKDAQVKEIEKNNHKIMHQYYDDDNDAKRSYFDYLSEDSIFNICEYLEKYDLYQLRMTSISNSLIVFDIMKSYKVGVCNLNELIEQDEYKYSINKQLNSKIKMNFIKPFIKCKALLNIYSDRYHIETNNICILKSCKLNNIKKINEQKFKCLLCGKAFKAMHYIVKHMKKKHAINEQLLFNAKVVTNMTKFSQNKIEKNMCFWILDKSKTLILNNSNKLQFMSQDNTLNKSPDYRPVILRYFDTQRQRLQNVQFLWVEVSTSFDRIQTYILNNLLSIYKKIYPHLSFSFITRLLYTLNNLKQFASQSQCTLIKIYNSYSDFTSMNPMLESLKSVKNYSFGVMTFEINFQHPYFINFTPVHLCQAFHSNVKQFIADRLQQYGIKIKSIHDKHILLKQMEHYKCCQYSNQFLLNDEIDVNVTPLSTFSMVREQISSLFNCIIPARNIQIYKSCDNKWGWNVSEKQNSAISIHSELNHFTIISSNQSMSKKEIIFPSQYFWEIVAYDTMQDKKYNIYSLSIYSYEIDMDDFLNIFTFPKSPDTKFYVNYEHDECKSNNYSFVVNEFIHNIINTMSHSLYGDKYQSIINRYKNKDKYSFIVMNDDDVHTHKYKCYNMDEMYSHFKTSYKKTNIYAINILITPNIYINNKSFNSFNIIIRFHKILDRQMVDIGFPIKICNISKKCKLNDFVDRFLNDKNQYKFHCCYANSKNIDLDDILYDKLIVDEKNDYDVIITKELFIGLETPLQAIPFDDLYNKNKFSW